MNIPTRKKWGQTFLIDPNIIRKIVSVLAPEKKQHILEIGPGTGALTRPLSKICHKISAIEIDPMLCEYLENKKLKNVIIYNEDILKFNTENMSKNYAVVGNLPYNISTPILFKFMHQTGWKKLVVMLQKEVAERIISSENNKKYGRISIMMQTFFNIKLEFNIPKTVFKPQPKITSSLLLITPKKNVEIEYHKLKELVESAFRHRRKKLINNLKLIVNSKGLDMIQDKRAEQLSVQDYQQLIRYMK